MSRPLNGAQLRLLRLLNDEREMSCSELTVFLYGSLVCKGDDRLMHRRLRRLYLRGLVEPDASVCADPRILGDWNWSITDQGRLAVTSARE